jgi:ketosteroid isomerase-like protein
MRKHVIALSAVALALGLGGCGGGDPKGEARDAANEYFKALAAGDASGVCDHLTKDAQNAFTRQRRGKDCPAAVGEILNGPQGRVSKQIAARTKVKDVKVSGDNATAEAQSSQGIGVSLQMRKEDGDWKISQLPQ